MADTKSSTDTITKLLMILAIIGAVNWGLIGFFNFNLVDAILGGGTAEQTSTGSRVVYALVGLSGLIAAFLLPKLHTVEGRRLASRTAV
ncbi:MAG: DUF378 domain-containing protein [Deltaproteobacteria bacterium]|nr:DUF378 domain-containing protein [Deltaproteobacteria bacterium]